MKKITIFLSLAIVLALSLAACEPADTEPTPFTDITPEAPPLETPMETAAVETATPAEPVGTPVDTPDVGVSPTPTVDGTPAAIDEDQVWRVSQLIDYRVLDQDCVEAGQVEGLILDQDSGEILYLSVELEEAAGTTDTTGATGTPTPEENLLLVPWVATTLGEEEAFTGEATPVVGTPITADTPTPSIATPAGTPAADTPTPAAATPAPATPAPAVPGPLVECPGEERVIVLEINQAVLVDAPAFGEVPDLTAADWDSEVHAFWTDHFPILPVTGPGATANPVHLQQATGLSLAGPGGENLGAIVEMIVHTQRGQITHIVLRPGGLLTIEDGVVLIPWEAVTFEPDANRFVLNFDVDRAGFEQAPGFGAVEEVPDPRRDPTWVEEVETYWRDLR